MKILLMKTNVSSNYSNLKSMQSFKEIESIEKAVKAANGKPIEIFEAEIKSLGHYKEKISYEKVEIFPEPKVGPNADEFEDDEEFED